VLVARFVFLAARLSNSFYHPGILHINPPQDQEIDKLGRSSVTILSYNDNFRRSIATTYRQTINGEGVPFKFNFAGIGCWLVERELADVKIIIKCHAIFVTMWAR